MIKVYEVLKSLDISYPDKGQTGYSNMDTFYLTKGDFFFIEEGYWGRVEVNDLYGKSDISSNFVETNVLKKIVFKGGDDFWEEEDNINLFNPLINKSLNIEDALKKKLIIESVSWKRDDILEELGI